MEKGNSAACNVGSENTRPSSARPSGVCSAGESGSDLSAHTKGASGTLDLETISIVPKPRTDSPIVSPYYDLVRTHFKDEDIVQRTMRSPSPPVESMTARLSEMCGAGGRGSDVSADTEGTFPVLDPTTFSIVPKPGMDAPFVSSCYILVRSHFKVKV